MNAEVIASLPAPAQQVERTQGSILCVLNVSAGPDEELRDRLASLFAQQGRTVQIATVRNGGDLTAVVAGSIEAKDKWVIAAGGDGTINAVATALVGSETALAVLPTGTLNHFAKDMRIPLTLEDAVVNVFTGEAAEVDVGEVNGTIFLNNSSIGLYPGLVIAREALQQEGHGKWAAFARALVFSLWRYRRLTARVRLDDGRTIVASTPFLFVGNNRYETCAPHIGERKALDEGKLWICEAPRATRLQLAFAALRALVGLPRSPAMIELSAGEFTVETGGRRLQVATDGEVSTMTAPLRYRIRPRSLRVIVPMAEHGA